MTRQFGIELLIDPFEPGDDVLTRIDTFHIHGLIFLLTRSSWDSHYCQRELQVAKDHGLPVVFLEFEADGCHDAAVRSSVIASYADIANPKDKRMCERFFSALLRRIFVSSTLAQLRRTIDPEDAQKLSEALLDGADQLALAEMSHWIALTYKAVKNESARYFLAHTLGRCGTKEAMGYLKGLLQFETHPFPQFGISESIDNFHLLDRKHE